MAKTLSAPSYCRGKTSCFVAPLPVNSDQSLIVPNILLSADATLTFETELVSLKKRAVEEVFMRTIRFLAVPVAVVISIYYLYDKYRKAPTKRDLKGDKRGKKKKH